MSETTTQTTQENLDAVADAIQAGLGTAKQGVATAIDAASAALPTASHFLARFVYTTCYTISYGVVFPTTLVAMSVPKNNAFVQGVVDGADAAKQKVDEIIGNYGGARESGKATDAPHS